MFIPPLKMTARLKGILDRAECAAREYLSHEAHLLLALTEVDKTRAYLCFGDAHMSPYCRNRIGLSEDVAAVFIRIINRSREVPELTQAVVSGRISLTNAKVLTSMINKDNHVEWIEKASVLSKSKLKAEISRPEGRVTTSVTLELTEAELIAVYRSREVMCMKLDHFPSREEAVMKCVNEYLNQNDDLIKADRVQTRPNVSNKNRVNHRDRCRCQAVSQDGTQCGETKYLHHHHVVPLSHGGPDIPQNMITLCSGHHRFIHEIIDGHAHV